jgi:ribosome maturation factor RimP
MSRREELQTQLNQTAQRVIGDMGLELLEFRLLRDKRGNLLRLVIDRPDTPVSVHDCESVSRRLSTVLDFEDPIPGAYTIEVSSPGFKRLIRIPKDLDRFLQHRIRLKLKNPIQGRSVWIGMLIYCTEEIILDKTEIGQIALQFDNIEQANLDD